MSENDRFLEKKPDDQFALLMRSYILNEMELHEAALKDIDHILELTPDNAWALGQRAPSFIKAGILKKPLFFFENLL
ncbi:hypothetical protein Dalk_1222 [Desulfatibacillum aliphaticivorans]|uniref:Uncharacterized protein n=1 Tax=Desulfatibacillum aliphaticivorans TaxID=218208 RepID=B8F9H9_DESAL|nr:hypothetical protein Dalk_1222 [Desulfatibacillum aliphaticivorans]